MKASVLSDTALLLTAARAFADLPAPSVLPG